MAGIARELLARGVADWVPAAEVAAIAKSCGGARNEVETKTVAIRLVEAVLEAGLMKAGDVTDGGFVPWRLSVRASLRRIEREWAELGRSPDLGEGFWLENTPAGDLAAEADP